MALLVLGFVLLRALPHLDGFVRYLRQTPVPTAPTLPAAERIDPAFNADLIRVWAWKIDDCLPGAELEEQRRRDRAEYESRGEDPSALRLLDYRMACEEIAARVRRGERYRYMYDDDSKKLTQEQWRRYALKLQSAEAVASREKRVELYGTSNAPTHPVIASTAPDGVPKLPGGRSHHPTDLNDGARWKINCDAASTPTEKAICADASLLAFDGYLSQAYSVIRRTVPAEIFNEVRRHQIAWIKHRDSLCGVDSACLLRETKARTAALSNFARTYAEQRNDPRSPRDEATAVNVDGLPSETEQKYPTARLPADDGATKPPRVEAQAFPSKSPGIATERREDSDVRIGAEAIYGLAAQSVAVVLAFTPGRDEISQGSGVVIAPDSVATNCHVLKGQAHAVVMFKGVAYESLSVTGNESLDYCVVHTAGLPAKAALLAPLSTVAPGQRVYSIGSPQGLELTIAEGLVSGLRKDKSMTYIQTSAAISHGSSGGGLFDERGRVIGITTMLLKDSQNLNFALPIELFEAAERRAADGG